MEYGIWSFHPLGFSLFLHFTLITIVHFSGIASVSGQETTGVRRVIGPTVYDRSGTFTTRCETGELVLVDAAILEQGAECQNGKCIVDVTVRLDEMCSTKSSCNVRVNDLCNGTCSASLNVTYSCLRAVTRDCRQRCPSDTLTVTEGFLTSETTLERSCGTIECPWYIQVPPGQNIEITLYDFSGGRNRQTQRGPRTNNDNGCVVVKERANPKETKECITGRIRQRVVYTTVSNTVELQLDPKQEKFILHYRAIGCPDIVPPYNSRVKRIGEKCEIDCPGSDLKWTLTCEGHKWLGADKLVKCPGKFYAPGSLPNPQETEAGSGSSSSSLPMGILITAVVAITVIIAVLVLTIGFVYMKKKQYETKPVGVDPQLYGAPTSEFEFCADFTRMRPGAVPKAGTATARSTRSGGRRSVELLGPIRDNTMYAADKQLEMQPLHRPLPMIPGVDGCVGTWGTNDPKRIMVQLHNDGLGTMSVIPPYPTMMMRDGRLLPCNCGGTLRTHPSQMLENRPPSHLYFTLDPEVKVEEPATLGRSYPAIEQGGGEESNHAVPHAHRQNTVGPVPPSAGFGVEMEDEMALMPPPPPDMLTPLPHPSDMNCMNAAEMVPLNLTMTNRAKHANQNPDNPMPLNLTPPHKKSLSSQQNPNDEAHWNFQPRQNPSVGVSAHS